MARSRGPRTHDDGSGHHDVSFHGAIKVDPNKVYVDRETGKRAAQALRERVNKENTDD